MSAKSAKQANNNFDEINNIDVNLSRRAFQQYRQLCLEIRELEEEKQEVAAASLSASRIRADGGAKGNRQADPVAQTAARLWQLAQLVAQRLNQLVALRAAVEAAIEGLPPADRRLLRLYYIKGLSFEEAAEQLGYSPRHLRRRHQQIIDDLFPEAPASQRQLPAEINFGTA